jgi:hypothetical protein
MTTIDLVLTDDWELRGDGSGDIRTIQFANLRTLTHLYEDVGLRGSFNPEVLQQLYHLRFAGQHPELLEVAHEWAELVRTIYQRGHDVQLHVHPQWYGARYCNGRWNLPSDWTLGHHPAERVSTMIAECKAYLEALVRPLDPVYRRVSFRAGTWALVPSERVLTALIRAGIVVDISVAPGLVKSGEVEVDYRHVDEPFLPYCPDLRDARRIGAHIQSVTCLPTQGFSYRPIPNGALAL